MIRKGEEVTGGSRPIVAGEDIAPGSLVYERDGKVYAFGPPKPRRLPLWERVVCYVLDSLTAALDRFTRWVQR